MLLLRRPWFAIATRPRRVKRNRCRPHAGQRMSSDQRSGCTYLREFILELAFVVYTLTASSSARIVSGLRDEVGHDAMKRQPIVIAFKT